jgi:ribosomal protein S17
MHEETINAHDESNKPTRSGDEVRIEESKPISKLKTWVVITEAQAS